MIIKSHRYFKISSRAFFLRAILAFLQRDIYLARIFFNALYSVGFSEAKPMEQNCRNGFQFDQMENIFVSNLYTRFYHIARFYIQYLLTYKCLTKENENPIHRNFTDKRYKYIRIVLLYIIYKRITYSSLGTYRINCQI